MLPSTMLPSKSRPTTGSTITLVTGATGFLGRRLVEILAGRGNTVRVLVRLESTAYAFRTLPVQIVQGDLTDPTSLAASMADVDVVYNCAGLSADWGRWQAFHAANVQGVENLLAAAQAAGTVRRFVHVSTTDVYGYPERPCAEDADLRDTGLPYNRSKVIGDRTVQAFHRRSGLATIIIRPVTIYGPRSKDFVVEAARQILAGRLALIDGGRCCAGLIYVDDVATAMIEAAQTDRTIGQCYNIRHPEPVAWRDYFDALARMLGLPPVRWSVPRPVALAAAMACEIAYGLARMPGRPLVTRHAVHLLSRDQGFPVERARREFGFQPAIDFAAGMARTRDWLDSPEGRRAIAGSRPGHSPMAFLL